MDNRDILYIENFSGKRLYYKFTPAENPEQSPLLIILHGHQFSAKPSRFYDRKWNVLVPIDNHGVEQCGSWWLGENGDFFVKALLHILIQKIRLETNSDKGIYFWGSSMGGYGALLHGMILGAKAVYANIPQIKLLYTSYAEAGSKKFFEPIFGRIVDKQYNDVTNFLNTRNPTQNPLFFIAQSRFDYPNYLQEHGLYFFNKCIENGINLHFEVLPVKGHKLFYPIHECIKYFERFANIVEEDHIFKKFKNSINFTNVNIGQDLFKSKELKIEGFQNFPLHEMIEWERNIYNSRTWMWHLHKMDYISQLTEYYTVCANIEVLRYAFNLIASWYENFKDDLKNKYAWHDHATALRSQNILKLYLLMKTTQTNIDKKLFFLEKILDLHVKQLQKESFYSKFTNHGLDQSLVLFELSSILPNLQKSKELALDRIRIELSHAFSKDGGHVENSPAYLNFGLKQVFEALSLVEKIEGNQQAINLFPMEILNNAIKFLAYITQPNGMLPLIGDTKSYKVKNFLKNTDSKYYNEFLYSIRQAKQGQMPKELDLVLKDSGWAIFRESWEKNNFLQSTHIVFKCGFLSNYHRHDDDLHFTLFSDNEEWLIDGGEYKHEPKDPYRIYFRSSDSHNLSKPYNFRAHRILADSSQTGIISYKYDNGVSFVEGETYMFKGFESLRAITYNRKNNSIKLHDRCYPITSETKKIIQEKYKNKYATYVTRFHIPLDKKVTIRNSTSVEIIGKQKILTINALQFRGHIKIIKAQNEPIILGWRSRNSGVLEECYTIEFYHKVAQLDQSFSLAISPKVSSIKDRMIVTTKIENEVIYGFIDTQLDKKNLQYAFYLMYKNEKIEQRWYEKRNEVKFNYDTSKDLSKYSIIGFIRDLKGNKYQKRVFLKND